MPTQARDHHVSLATENVSQPILSNSQPGQDKIGGPASSNQYLVSCSKYTVMIRFRQWKMLLYELYMYYTVLYRKFSGLRRRYNTNYIVMTNYTRGLLNQTVSYRSISYSDPALIFAVGD